jgi:hypothetical protein
VEGLVTVELDEGALQRELEPLLDDPTFREGIEQLTRDPFFVTYFLVSVSQGEALGEKAVALIGQEELARLIHDLERQEREERSHKEQTLEVARELFPEYFVGDRYRFGEALDGRPYYVAVLEANRRRLKELGRYSRLNLYLTTTFAYEIMVMLLYGSVAEAMGRSAMGRSSLARETRGRVEAVLRGILDEEATHLGVIDQHNALLEAPRAALSEEVCSLLDSLAKLSADDYRRPAEHAVRQVVAMMQRYADPDRQRSEIEAGAAHEEASHARL